MFLTMIRSADRRSLGRARRLWPSRRLRRPDPQKLKNAPSIFRADRPKAGRKRRATIAHSPRDAPVAFPLSKL